MFSIASDLSFKVPPFLIISRPFVETSPISENCLKPWSSSTCLKGLRKNLHGQGEGPFQLSLIIQNLLILRVRSESLEMNFADHIVASEPTQKSG